MFRKHSFGRRSRREKKRDEIDEELKYDDKYQRLIYHRAWRESGNVGKLVLDSKYQQIRDLQLISPVITSAYDGYYFEAISVAVMSNGRYFAFGECPQTGARQYVFNKIKNVNSELDIWNNDVEVIKFLALDNSVVLPPFEIHVYD